MCFFAVVITSVKAEAPREFRNRVNVMGEW